jgi:hypothetical protein
MSLENYLFGPLDKSYCMLFYVFSVIYYIGFVMVLLGTVTGLFVYKSKITFAVIFAAVWAVFSSFLMYIITRLLYSMCVNSKLDGFTGPPPGGMPTPGNN